MANGYFFLNTLFQHYRRAEVQAILSVLIDDAYHSEALELYKNWVGARKRKELVDDKSSHVLNSDLEGNKKTFVDAMVKYLGVAEQSPIYSLWNKHESECADTGETWV